MNEGTVENEKQVFGAPLFHSDQIPVHGIKTVSFHQRKRGKTLRNRRNK
jgi:hypothetical protein